MADQREEIRERLQVINCTKSLFKKLLKHISFRSSTIDFINILIDKHRLEQEKVKMTFVIHPHGKKFMSLVLDLIKLAIKEVIKRRNFASNKSFDIDEVMTACTNIKAIENELVTSIKSETQVIHEKTTAIQKCLEKIFPAKDFSMSFEELISSWHELNAARMADIKKQNEEMDAIYRKTALMVERAQKMLQPKIYDTSSPPLEVIKEVAEFFVNAGTKPNDFEPITEKSLNISWLIAQLNAILPTIVNYVSNYTVDPSQKSHDELKSLQKYSLELRNTEKKIDDFCEHWRKTIPLLIAKFKAAKEERQKQEREQQTAEELAAEEAKQKLELEKLNLLFEPKYYFDATRECLKHVVVKKNRLALIDDDGNENLVNETKLYRSVKSTLANKSKVNQANKMEMGPPKQEPRRRFDPMQMLERAIQPSNSRSDLNSTKKYLNASKVRPSTPKFSSTMLSPDFRQPLFNCSTVSEIAKHSPLNEASILDSIFQEASNVHKTSKDHHFSGLSRTPLSSHNAQSQQFQSEKTNPNVDLKLNDETIKGYSNTQMIHNATFDTSNEKTESTLRLAKENSQDIHLDSFSSGWMINDENLFNVSDTLLKNVEY